jgi:cytochrome c oxidase subunit II
MFLFTPLLHRILLESPLRPSGPSFWMPPQDSTIAPDVDRVFYFVYAVSVFFFLLIVLLMTAFVIRYRFRPGVEQEPAPNKNTFLELLWTFIPIVIVIVIFYEGFRTYLNERIAPQQAYEIQVTAARWSWTFTYPNGHQDGELHVPAGEPVRLVMSSRDVIHSLFIPDFRVKQDIVPGRYTKAWFNAPEPGNHLLLCAEYCGTQHSDMHTVVVVHGSGDFEAWMNNAENFMKNLSPPEAGKILYQRLGCSQCHSVDGTAGVGPSFLGIWGQTHEFTNAPPTVVDENYVRESILEPSKKIRRGFNDQMNTFKGQVSDEQINALIAFIKSMKKGDGKPGS